jgi:two-component system chemotaxis response regulator CheB
MSRSDSPGAPATVLVVDDSVFMRRMISDMIDGFSEYSVVGAAADGEEALRCIKELDPDVVTLDIEMPRLDGFGVLERAMSTRPRPFVVISAYTEHGSEAAMRALELGAVDIVPKPSGPVSFDVAAVRAQLYTALEAARAADVARLTAGTAAAWPRAVAAPTGARNAAVAIAASTGGPHALGRILGALPADLGAAVLVVQHMPPGFTAALAARLDSLARVSVAEATGDAVVKPNQVLIAPGDFHMRVMRVESDVRVVLDQQKPIWGTRPAADALFPSVADAYGERCVGVVLTGMGRDGASGLGSIRAAGGRTLAQDRDSCVVYGMPARAIDEDAVDMVLPLDEIPAAVVDCLSALPAAETW